MLLDSREIHADDQPALGPVGRHNASAMQPYDAVRNGESQAESSCFTLASIVDSVERTENCVELFLRNTRAAVPDAQFGPPMLISLSMREVDFDNSILRCIAERIPQNILEGTFEQSCISQDGTVLDELSCNLTAAQAGFVLNVWQNLANETVKGNTSCIAKLARRFHIGQRKKAGD